MISLDVNGKTYPVEVGPDVPLLWVLREHLKLTGTKFGCGIGACGSCTVHIDGKAVRSCQTPVGTAQGKKIRTIEGLGDGHPVVLAWIKEQVPSAATASPARSCRPPLSSPRSRTRRTRRSRRQWTATSAGAAPIRASGWRSRPRQRRGNGHEEGPDPS